MIRRKFSAEFKMKVVLEALNERYSLSEVEVQKTDILTPQNRFKLTP